MTTPTDITADWAKIRRRVKSGRQVYLFVTIEGIKGCPPEVLAKITEAIDQANAKSCPPHGPRVRSTPPTAMPKAALIDLSWDHDTHDAHDATNDWIAEFAANLAEAGLTARLTLPSPASIPRAVGNNISLHPAAYLAYTLTNPLAPLKSADWGITDHLASDLVQAAADWVDRDGTDLYFSLGAFPLRVIDPDLTALITTAMHRRPLISVDAVTTKPPRATTAALGHDGTAVFGIVADDIPVRDRIEALRATMLRDPASLDIALIRPTRGFPFTWRSMTNSPTKFPGIDNEADWSYNRHMWTRFVPDACPLQILTNHHLERANDLSDWTITEVADNRYLVEAKDIEAWFDYPGTPPHEVFAHPDLIAQARADFGPMIMTMDDIHNDPNGWTGGPYPPDRAPLNHHDD